MVSGNENRNAPAVKVENLVAGYGGRILLSDVSFSIEKGSIVTILGPSGCGKSTLLKHLIGLQKPLSGAICLLGNNIAEMDEEETGRVMSSFGVAYQGGALFRSLTVAENVALPMEEYTTFTREEIREKVMEKLKMVNLEKFGDLMPSDLSGGMIKRAAFARAMALDPEILFFDEPSAGLDPISSSNLDELILKIREKTKSTIIVVTHELDSIFRISDRSIMLDPERKNIIADGKPEELRESSPEEKVRFFLNRGKL